MTRASIVGSTRQLNAMVTDVAVGYHEDLYVGISDGTVRLLMQTNGRQVVSYGTFETGFFSESVDGEVEALIPVGGSGSDAKGFLDYMGFVERETGTVEVSFDGEKEVDGHTLATHLEFEGALNARIRLNSSADDVSQVPFDHPPRWTPTNEYCSTSCLTDDGYAPSDSDDWVVGPSVVKTTASIVEEKIIEPAAFTDGVNYYPLTVEEGRLVVDVAGEQYDDEIWGEVNAENVEGPDFSRAFAQGRDGSKSGFECVFGQFTGPVRVQTAPDGSGGSTPPATVVQDERDDRTLRHLIGALAN